MFVETAVCVLISNSNEEIFVLFLGTACSTLSDNIKIMVFYIIINLFEKNLLNNFSKINLYFE